MLIIFQFRGACVFCVLAAPILLALLFNETPAGPWGAVATPSQSPERWLATTLAGLARRRGTRGRGRRALG